eukprot:scaffold1149_cov27-Tisochrysis_lutea.AAC.2
MNNNNVAIANNNNKHKPFQEPFGASNPANALAQASPTYTEAARNKGPKERIQHPMKPQRMKYSCQKPKGQKA